MTPLLASLLLSGPAHAGWAPVGKALASYDKAVEAYEAGALEKALRLAERAHTLQPDCGMCGSLVGSTLLLLDQPDEALALLLPLVEDHPDQGSLRIIAAEAAFAAQRFEDSRDLALQALDHGAVPLEAHRTLMRAQLRLGEYDEAAAALAAAAEVVDAHELSCLVGELHVETGELDQARLAAHGCGDSEARTMLEGWIASAAGDYDLAADHSEALAADTLPDLLRAIAAYNRGDLDVAESLLDRMLRRGTPHAQAWALRGLVHYQRGNAEAALRDLSAALEHPEYVEVHRTGSFSGVITKAQAQEYRGLLRRAAVVRMVLSVDQLSPVEARALALDTGRLLDEPWIRELCEAVVDQHQGRISTAWERLALMDETYGEEPALVLVRDRLVAADPDAVPAWAEARLDEAQRAWLVERAEVASHNARVAAEQAIVDAYNGALAAARDGRCRAALDQLAALDGRLREDMVRPARDLRYHCAVMTGDLAQAEDMLARYGVGGLPALVVYNHGVLRQNQGDSAGGRALAEQACAAADGADHLQCELLLRQ